MRVLHVIEATIGGTRRHLVDVVRGQLGAGLDVHVAASAERCPEFRAELERLADAGAGVLELPMVREISPRTDARHFRLLCRHLRELAPDVVHTHSSKAGVLGRSASLRTGVGVRVHTPHTFAFLFKAMFGPGKRVLFRGIERTLARRTQAVVAVSASEAESFRVSGVVPPDRIRVVPNGIDPGPWRTAVALERAALGVPERAPLCAVVGLLNVAKGQDLLLRALAAADVPTLHLLVVGRGETEAELRDLARELAVAERAHFLGHRDDVPEILAAVDWLVLPSRWEGMPYVLLEALAAGRPVLASAVDGARDLIRPGDTGLLAPVGSVEGLARGLEQMAALAPAALSEMGRAARERFDEGHSAEDMVAGLIRVYEELM